MGRIVRLSSLGIVALLIGCSGPPGPPGSIAESERMGGLPADAIATSPGIPFGPLPGGGPSAGWLDDGARFAVVLGGSSSCPSFPSSIDVIDKHRLKIGVSTSGGPVCTADLVPRTYVIRTPDGVDTSGQVTLLFGESSAVLPPL